MKFIFKTKFILISLIFTSAYAMQLKLPSIEEIKARQATTLETERSNIKNTPKANIDSTVRSKTPPRMFTFSKEDTARLSPAGSIKEPAIDISKMYESDRNSFFHDLENIHPEELLTYFGSAEDLLEFIKTNSSYIEAYDNANIGKPNEFTLRNNFQDAFKIAASKDPAAYQADISNFVKTNVDWIKQNSGIAEGLFNTLNTAVPDVIPKVITSLITNPKFDASVFSNFNLDELGVEMPSAPSPEPEVTMPEPITAIQIPQPEEIL